MGYAGGKLNGYLHYQYVSETEALLEKLHETKGTLPSEIKSLILFGLGTGYQLQALLETHCIDKLFICEPNRDFFYASLFAIDWQAIFDDVDSNEKRLYINIGDDGSNLSRDLTQQFYAIGPYNIADTYFYQSYYNPTLSHAIANMREHLQLMISMGEYFDHARFGISHTKEMIERGAPILVNKKNRAMNKNIAEVPVFIIGNGPSLDASIDALKEWKDTAIVISCGTALMPLERAGITPDFHAEIEQNRSTFDWCSRVGAFNYLKNITLISCNGIHPDTSDLFKNCLIAFKDGESSTVSTLEVLGRENYSELEFAFPTVANLVTNLVCELGFAQIYLFGIDLGFVDDSYHHSKDSGYYDEDGNELYDYREANNTAIKTVGNFRKHVFTKYEFKISRSILEQVFARYPTSVCYNTSDGARIKGASPLDPELILTTSTPQDKQHSIHFIHTVAFKPADNFSNFATRYAQRFQLDSFKEEAEKLLDIIENSEPTKASASELIHTQRKFIFDSYSRGKSLLFYLFHGSINYSNAFLSKVLASDEAETLMPEALSFWQKWAKILIDDYLEAPEAFDLTSSFRHLRVDSYCKKYALKRHCEFFVPDAINHFESAYKDYFTNNSLNTNIATKELVFFNHNWNESQIKTGLTMIEESRCHILFIGTCNWLHLQNWKSLLNEKRENTSYYYYPSTHDDTLKNENLILSGDMPFFTPVYHARQMSLMRKHIDRECLFIQKLRFITPPSSQALEELKNHLACVTKVTIFIDFGNYLAIPLHPKIYKEIAVDLKGDRGIIRHRHITLDDLYFLIDESAYIKQKQWLAAHQ